MVKVNRIYNTYYIITLDSNVIISVSLLNFRELFHQLDYHHSGTISREDFESKYADCGLEYDSNFTPKIVDEITTRRRA